MVKSKLFFKSLSNALGLTVLALLLSLLSLMLTQDSSDSSSRTALFGLVGLDFNEVEYGLDFTFSFNYGNIPSILIIFGISFLICLLFQIWMNRRQIIQDSVNEDNE